MSDAFDAFMLEAGLPTLEELVDRPPWMKDGACREHSDVDFYPAKGQPTAPAKAVCATCLVRSECLSYAVEHREQGIWGGLSERERRQVRTRSDRDAA